MTDQVLAFNNILEDIAVLVYEVKVFLGCAELLSSFTVAKDNQAINRIVDVILEIKTLQVEVLSESYCAAEI